MKKHNSTCANQYVNIERRDDEIIIHILGDFNYVTTPLVHKCCKTIKKDDDIKRIILDFKNAGKVDTSAFACLINYIKQNKGSLTKIVATNLHQFEIELLRILKIEKIIHIV